MDKSERREYWDMVEELRREAREPGPGSPSDLLRRAADLMQRLLLKDD